MAMNAYRNYNNNTSALSKNLEKLSSGYKINRAGDDAAGQQGRHGGRRRGHPAQPFPLLHRNSFQAPGSLPGIQLP